MSPDREAASPDLPASLAAYRYKPRTIGPMGVQTFGRWRCKGTAITVRGRAVHFPEIVEAAWDEAARLLADAPTGGRDAGVAFLTLHLGLEGVWLLLDWWIGGDMLMHRHLRASLDNPTRFTDTAGQHLGPCVWELAVQAHERDAWLRHVLCNPAGPDLDAYLADGMEAAL